MKKGAGKLPFFVKSAVNRTQKKECDVSEYQYIFIIYHAHKLESNVRRNARGEPLKPMRT